MPDPRPSRVSSKLAVIFCIFAVLVCTVSGALFSLNIVLSKKHLAEIMVQYSEKDETEEAKYVFSLLDGSDFSAVKDMIADGRAVSALNSLRGGISELAHVTEGGSIFDDVAGLSGFGSMFSGVASILRIINGDYTIVSVALDTVDADSLVTAEQVNYALYECGAYSGENGRAQAFLRTRLAAELTASLAYRYYDYCSGGEDDPAALAEELRALIDSRRQDLLILGVDENAAPAFALALSQTLVATTPPPAEKEISGGARTLLGMLFSVRMAFVYLFLGCLNFGIVWLLLRSGKTTLKYWGVCFVITGIAVAALQLLKKHIIGSFFTGSRYFALDFAFVIVGGAILIAGILILTGVSIYDKVKNRQEKLQYDPSSNVLTAGDITIIQKFGLSDLVMNDEVEKNRRSDGTIDYYGDGRGLEAQREFLRKQKEREEAKKKAQIDAMRGFRGNNAPGQNGTPGGTPGYPTDGENDPPTE